MSETAADAAAHHHPGTGNFGHYSDHLVSLAAQDETNRATERERAARAVRRLAGPHADTILAALGLTDHAQPRPEPRPGPKPNHRPRYPRSTNPKQCPRCHEIKDADQFHTGAHNRDGLASWCKGCTRVAVRDQKARKAQR